MIKKCVSCFKTFEGTDEKCPYCKSNNVITFNENKIKYREINYTKKEWLVITSSYSKFDETDVRVKNSIISLPMSYLKSIFLENAKISTFFALILPSIVFSVLSLITLTTGIIIEIKRNAASDKSWESIELFVFFICVIFALFAIYLLIKLFVFKEKCVYTKYHFHIGYRHYRKEEFDRLIYLFDYHINNYEFHYFKPITTDRLFIRELKIQDSESYFKFASNPNVCKYLMWDTMTLESEALELMHNCQMEYVNEKIFKLGVFKKDQFIGYIGLSKYDLSETTCQIVYAIDEEYWNKGYATEVVNVFVEWLINHGKAIIYAGHVEENIASGKVLEKCGFRRDISRDTDMIIHDEQKHILSYILESKYY